MSDVDLTPPTGPAGNRRGHVSVALSESEEEDEIQIVSGLTDEHEHVKDGVGHTGSFATAQSHGGNIVHGSGKANL